MSYSSRNNVPQVTKNLILINVVVFVFYWISQNMLDTDVMITSFALFYPGSRYFHWWQVITHMFMHGGFWHILFNMYSLYLFGSVVENMIGSKKFLVFYFICGLGSAALHLGVQSIQAASLMNAIADGSQTAAASLAALKMTPTVGASGAIYGVLIAYAMLFPDSKLTLLFPPVTLSAKWMVTIFAGIELLTGVTGTVEGVAHFAHLGGMLLGWLLIIFWRRRGVLFDRERYF